MGMELWFLLGGGVFGFALGVMVTRALVRIRTAWKMETITKGDVLQEVSEASDKQVRGTATTVTAQ